jgi:hypothetical protein
VPSRGKRYADLETTPELRRAIVDHPDTLTQLAAAVRLTAIQISKAARGEPFSEKLRERIVALGGLVGVASDRCIRPVKR